MPQKLDTAALDDALATLPAWSHDADAGSIHRRFEFDDFNEAFAFMTRVARLADAADHHPDWSNSYDKVNITLSTHDAGGLTQNDIDLARGIDGVVEG